MAAEFTLTGPSAAAPPRRPGSIRRTSSLDLAAGPMKSLGMAGRARDLATLADGSTAVLASALTKLTIDADRRVAAATSHPDGDRVARLAGRPVKAGFRTAIWRVVPDLEEAGTPLHLLLDDVPGALVISGFVARKAAQAAKDGSLPPVARRPDVCIGWAIDSDAMRRYQRDGTPPPPDHEPPAVDLCADDPIGWHTMAPLPISAMRRARRIDVWSQDGTWQVDAMFRDSFVSKSGGPEKILHEYALAATIDPRTHQVLAAAATPRVLPHLECPLGAASAGRIVGVRADALRDVVSLEFFGPTTCTHLNDVLRGLADVPTLARALRDEAPDAPRLSPRGPVRPPRGWVARKGI